MRLDIAGFDEAISAIKRTNRALWNLCHPRRYAPPLDYANPEYNSAYVASSIEIGRRVENLNKTQIDCILSSWAITSSGCPVIFVKQDLLESLVVTDPPEAMQMTELNWPFEGMTFVLPRIFYRQAFRRDVPFINLARMANGRQSAPPEVNRVCPGALSVGIDHPGGYGWFVTGMIGDTPEKWFDFSGSYHMDWSVRETLTNATFSDFTRSGKAFDDCDKETIHRMTAIAIHLLMVMNSIPEWLEVESQSRKERRDKHGIVTQEALWHPRFLGRNYQWHREHGESLGGTHASPRLHPRRGHWRNQPHGKQLALRKLIWIRPVMVGASETKP